MKAKPDSETHRSSGQSISGATDEALPSTVRPRLLTQPTAAKVTKRRLRSGRTATLRPAGCPLGQLEHDGDSTMGGDRCNTDEDSAMQNDDDSDLPEGDSNPTQYATDGSGQSPNHQRAVQLLGPKYTSLAATRHSQHPEISPSLFMRAACALGARAIREHSLPAFTCREQITFDAPMDDKHDPRYDALSRGSATHPHTALYTTSPLLSFPQVTMRKLDKAAAKATKKLPFKDRDYFARHVLVPLLGSSALVFPDETFEETAFESSKTGAPPLKGRIASLGSDLDTDSHVNFPLTDEIWQRARRKLQVILDEQCCPSHTTLLPLSAKSCRLDTPCTLGPKADCDACQTKLVAVRKTLNLVFGPHCDVQHDKASKCDVCRRVAKYTRQSPEDELQETKQRWADDWPQVWHLPHADWTHMQSKGVLEIQ